MEKLELKHLAPYLPYGLKIRTVSQPSFTNQPDHVDDTELTGGNIHRATKKKMPYRVKSIKPILRPLSDLRKCIEHGTERFTPFHRIAEKLLDRESESFSDEDSCYAWVANHISKFNQIKGYDNVMHWVYQDLIKWHFDVFELIEEGLAIDINTLN